MARSLTAKEILNIRHQSIRPGGEWGKCVGEMDRHGVVFIWGNSGNGKTSAVVSLCKELSNFGKTLFVSLEEGFSLSFQNTLKRYDMYSCGAAFQVIDGTTVEELTERLSKPRSPEFVVIDSFQYLGLSYRQYLAFKKRFPNKLLVFVSHADGKQPEGRAAKSVKYDSGLKIWVEGYVAFSNGRFFGETGQAVIWQQGAWDYWSKRVKDNNNTFYYDNNEENPETDQEVDAQ